MRVDDRLGTFDEVAAAAPAQVDTLRAVRALVGRLHPDAQEVASRREKSIWWGFGPAKMTQGYVWAMPHSAHVNLGFFQGATLPDPDRLLGGTGKALRHMKLRHAAEVDRPAVHSLITAARDERRAALGL